jgi:hypothetical protein
VKLHSCITDSKREDEDPKWNIHKCDLGLWKQTTKDQFSNVQLNDDQNLEHMYQQFEDNFLNCCCAVFFEYNCIIWLNNW